jgi:3-hydroxybutyryl-CoA dehydratase
MGRINQGMPTPSVGDEIPPLSLAIEREMMERFGVLIDDRNPVHFDDDFAKAKGFPAAIAHSAVGSSLILRMLTGWLGAWPLREDGLDIAFVAPVHVGYMLTARGRCIEVGESSSVWEVWCEMQEGKKVIAGKAQIAAARKA